MIIYILSLTQFLTEHVSFFVALKVTNYNFKYYIMKSRKGKKVKNMKTNISGLMNIISEEERKLKQINTYLETRIYSISIQELNGTINIIEDYKQDFEKELEEYQNILTRITNLKSILYQKNNSFKLSDGRTIQAAIIDNSNLRKLKSTYDYLLNFRNVKRRVTEVNNSYFECKTINYNVDKIKELSKDLEDKIQKTDFEISKLNSIEFEIEL